MRSTFWNKWLLALLLITPLAHSNPNALTWPMVQAPGVHALMRHATAPGVGDPEQFKLGDCSTQRNLSEQGRQEAKALGELLRQQGVNFTEVRSSPWCRTLDTATAMNLGAVQVEPVLASFFENRGNAGAQTLALKNLLAQLPPQSKALLVTHQVNITSLVGNWVDSGQMVFVRVNAQSEVQVLGTLKAGRLSGILP